MNTNQMKLKSQMIPGPLEQSSQRQLLQGLRVQKLTRLLQ